MLIKNYVVEAVGTFFLVFVLCLTPNALAIGLLFSALVYMGKHISGAHFNPAVTLAVLVRRKMEPVVAGCYMLSQCVGAFFAAALFHMVFKGVFFPKPVASVGMMEAILIEALLTFLFCLTILTMTSGKFNTNFVYGLVIGLTLTGIIIVGGEISGGAFNPAVGLGTILFNEMMGGASMQYLWIYLIGPAIGGALAAVGYTYLNE